MRFVAFIIAPKHIDRILEHLRRTAGLPVGANSVGFVCSAAGLAATRLIAASLYEITPGYPATVVGMAPWLGGVAITAAVVPATRTHQAYENQTWRE